MNMVVVRTDRAVLSMQLKAVDYDSVVNNTYHRSHHPTRNYPFDDVVVLSNLKTDEVKEIEATSFFQC